MKSFLTALSIVALTTVALEAGPIGIDFAGQGTQGSITQSGDDIMGSDILIDRILIFGGSDSDGTYDIVGGALNFEAGPGGNSFAITGAVPDLGIGDTTLFSGTFSHYEVNSMGGNVTGFTGNGEGTLGGDLLALLPVDRQLPWTFGGFSIGLNDGQGGIDVTSTDFVAQPVPEPGTMALFGLSLAGLGLVARRRRKQAA